MPIIFLQINAASGYRKPVRCIRFAHRASARPWLTVMHQRFLWIFEIFVAGTVTALQPTHATSCDMDAVPPRRHESPPPLFSILPVDAIVFGDELLFVAFRRDSEAARRSPRMPGQAHQHCKYRRTPTQEAQNTGLGRAQWEGALDYLWQRGADKVFGARSPLSHSRTYWNLIPVLHAQGLMIGKIRWHLLDSSFIMSIYCKTVVTIRIQTAWSCVEWQRAVVQYRRQF